MHRKAFGALALLAGYLMACSDLPTTPPATLKFGPLLAVSDPPPPPADGDEIPLGNQGQCGSGSICPTGISFIQIFGLRAHYFKAPGANTAFVTFSSDSPLIDISADARVLENPTGLFGRGTISALVFLAGSPFPTQLIVDLSFVEGTLAPRPVSFRHFFFTATGRNAQTGAAVGTVLFWYEF